MRAVTTILAIALVVVVGLYLTDPAGAWAVDLIRQASALFGVTILLAKLNFATFGFWAILILAAALLLMIAIKHGEVGRLEAVVRQKDRDHAEIVNRLSIDRGKVDTKVTQLTADLQAAAERFKKVSDDLKAEQQKSASKAAPKLSDTEASLKFLETYVASLDVSLTTIESYEGDEDDEAQENDWRIRLEKIKATIAGLKARMAAQVSRQAIGYAMTEVEQLIAQIEHEAGSVEADALRKRMAEVTGRIEVLSKNLDHAKPKLVAG